jgi:hypothetical protein
VGARTETTSNNTRDFYIGKRLCNLPALRQVGFQANRRLLEVECLSHDCAVGEEALHQLNRPVEVDGQRTSALRTIYACWRYGTSWSGFVCCPVVSPIETCASNSQCSPGKRPPPSPRGRMTYDLRRLRLHGMIERIPKTHRYRVTPFGLRAALFFTRVHGRLYRPAVAEVMSNGPPDNIGLAHQFARLEAEIDKRIQHTKLVA